MPTNELMRTAAAMVAAGKGILAADESIPTMSKRLEKAGIPVSAETRRAYRSMIVTTPGLEKFISAVILADETFRQRTDDDVPIPEAVAKAGMLPGIKVDTGAKPLAFAEGETVTEGLDGLRDRLAEYSEMGARFAKWRAVIRIDRELPSDACLSANAHALSRYAALCQEADIVPIVEPEVLMDGDHPIERCRQVTERTLRRVFNELAEQRVALEGMVLKPNMVAPGKDCSRQAGVDEVASVTVRCLRGCVPAAVPGIAFLSGGQSPEQATQHLQAINLLGPQPWQLTFSYGRALLDPPLAAWKGEPSNVQAAQQGLHHRARCNAAAREGRYDPSMEQA
jgi:fructose-bisphosphate aldolase class I